MSKIFLVIAEENKEAEKDSGFFIVHQGKFYEQFERVELSSEELSIIKEDVGDFVRFYSCNKDFIKPRKDILKKLESLVQVSQRKSAKKLETIQ